VEVIKLDLRAQFYYKLEDKEELYDEDDDNNDVTPYMLPFKLFISLVG